MGRLFETILEAVGAGLGECDLIEERRGDSPNAVVVVRQTLPDGASVVVVWSWLESLSAAKLVTVYFQDE